MSPDSARRMIVGGLLIAGSLSVVEDVSRGQRPQLRTGVGIVVAGVLLAAVAGPLPDLAGALGALIGVAAVLSTGAEAFGSLSKGLSA